MDFPHQNGKHFIHEVVPELLDALESGSHSKNEKFARLADLILFVITLAFKDVKNFSYHGSAYGQPLVRKVVESYEAWIAKSLQLRTSYARRKTFGARF